MDAMPAASDDLSLTDKLNVSSITDATHALVQHTESAVSTPDDIEQVKSEAITTEHIAGVNEIEPPALFAEEPPTFLRKSLPTRNLLRPCSRR